MKRSVSLRLQLFGLMALLVILQSVALISALAISRVFFMLDAEAFRLFDSATSARMQAYNASVGTLVSDMAMETKALDKRLAAVAAAAGIGGDSLYASDEAYMEASLSGTQSLIKLLQNNNISGAFFVLNGYNADKRDDTSRSAVYVRNSSPGNPATDNSHFLLEVGPIAVSQQFSIPTSINWRLGIPVATADGALNDYYAKPMWAATEYPRSELERYGYWSPPVTPLGDGQQVVLYTMPLIDANGAPYGVLGVEISLSLFTQYYLPNTDLPYTNSFYAISAIKDQALDLGWYIPSGPLAQVYLKQVQSLPLETVSGSDLYGTELEGLGKMYCSVQALTMYSRNSPFYEDSWSLIGFVPEAVLHETSSGVRSILLTSIAAITLGAFIAIFVLTFTTTRKIVGLSKYIRGLSPYREIHFTRTGIREIDELTAAVEMLSKSVLNAAKTTSKILELTLMPIGGFEISSESEYVIVTEFIYKLLGLAPGTLVSRADWERMYAEMVAVPTRAYENVYQYTDRESRTRWLRIVEADTDTGKVGVVLDASKDIEEHRRLAHELDYDALTHLYSRTAFKREAFALMQSRPDKTGVMVFVDLDNLKYMNDTFGHDMGDRLIIRAGEMFRQFERYGGVVSRISGDEFAMYLHGFEDKESAKAFIYRAYAQSDNYTLTTPDGATQKIRFSSGMAFFPQDSDNVTDLLKLSDYAMYEAKHNKKGTIFEFNQESYRLNAYVLENRESINRLLDEGLIRFAYQPIVDVKTGDIFAYEALMRPLLDNFKSPLEILTVASAQSKLGQLERLVVFTAFQAIRDHAEELGERKLFINSIPSQSLSDDDLMVLKREYGRYFDRAVVEITEAEKEAPENMKNKIAFVRENGILLALDDFGSGYSNEVRILSMNPHIVKVDIELVSHIDTNADKQKLVSNLISFCRPKGIRLVAEGVERSEELAALIWLGIDFVQGFYTARPAFGFEPLAGPIREEILRLGEGGV